MLTSMIASLSCTSFRVGISVTKLGGANSPSTKPSQFLSADGDGVGVLGNGVGVLGNGFGILGSGGGMLWVGVLGMLLDAVAAVPSSTTSSTATAAVVDDGADDGADDTASDG